MADDVSRLSNSLFSWAAVRTLPALKVWTLLTVPIVYLADGVNPVCPGRG